MANKKKKKQSVQTQVNEYELSRQLRVQENQKRARELGLKNLPNSMTSLVDSRKKKRNLMKPTHTDVRDSDYNPNDESEGEYQEFDASVQVSKKQRCPQYVAPGSLNRISNRVNAPKVSYNSFDSNATKKKRATVTTGELLSGNKRTETQRDLFKNNLVKPSCTNPGLNKRSVLVDEDDEEDDEILQDVNQVRTEVEGLEDIENEEYNVTTQEQHDDPLAVEHDDSLADQHVDESTKQSANPPKRRGLNLNLNITKNLHSFPEGSKIRLTMDKGTKTFVGDSATPFATEVGIVIRNYCPMNFHKWDLIPEDVKTLLYEKLEGKFELLRTDVVFMDVVDARLHAQWKRTRGHLSQHWKKNGGKTNHTLARNNMPPGCKPVDWSNLCDYWELDKTKRYSNQMELNRAEQVIVSRGGSRSIANHRFKMINPVTKTPPSPLEVYYKMHYNAKKQGWLNDHSRIEYEKIVQHKEDAVEKLKSEGTIVTKDMERGLENEAIKSVCKKAKTIQSGWEVGVGPVFRKKDKWMISATGPSQRDLSEIEDLRNKVTVLNEQLDKTKDELKHYVDRYEKLSEFITQKFPDFEIMVPTYASGEADSLDELHNNGEDTI